MTSADDKEWQGGIVLFTGGTDWATLGRSGGGSKKDKNAQAEAQRLLKYPNLSSPHRLKGLLDIRIQFVGAGCQAVHCLVGDVDGNLYTWGRNEKGQLGHGDTIQRNWPTLVEGLKGKKVITAAGGRFHSVTVVEGGDSYTFGSNSQGQCGTGSMRSNAKNQELITHPVRALVDNIASVAAGGEFTMWLNTEGKVYAAGLPQYGQLGDGTDHQYNAKDSAVKLVYDPQPTPKMLVALAGRRIQSIACGQNHTIAVDDEGKAFTWGFGGYGRLGHKVQKDEFTPKEIDTFRGRLTVPKDALIAAGSTSTFCTTVGDQLYAWGKLKISGDNLMYPQPYMELSGWKIRSMACGPSTYCVASERSTITWGHATNGELGYGESGKKTSAKPEKVESLEGIYTHQVASGLGFNLFLVDPDDPKVEERFPVFDAEEVCGEEEAAAEEEPAPAAKGRGGKKAAPAGRGKKTLAPEPAVKKRTGRGRK